MDVAKYIGLFLLKNNFVYIHGLGNLELRKKPATYEGDALKPPTYDVQLTPSGSIDDNLANFIANNEQISISKASNALREFSIQAKADLQAGKDVEIPAIGKFTETNGKISFVTNPAFNYTPPSLPVIKVATRQSEPVFGSGFNHPQQRPAPQPVYPNMPPQPEPYPEESRSSINWLRVGIAAGVLILLLVAVYFIISYMSGSNATKEKPLVLPPPSEEEQTVAPVAEDTSGATSVNDPNAGISLSFDVKLHGYQAANVAGAIRRMKELKMKGYTSVMMEPTEDSSMFLLLLPVEGISPADTAALIDSLRQNVNNSNILTIYRYR